ncbi:phospho-N-acetylmuramoyl-pentapeptide-transferase [Phormidium sp. LEGE 05292]|uniref:phospho-N-acetylmuramoyl-pentapeptide- transferase n=1 Tax=[Phormidium] sp. LEGE 05292 TaxID=767427 RepID=UPI00187F6083|nr:phospho-N-acetylmuramoyl-pentapeptide-transferase [Phormidium sp. LEGE 05292]MBE9228721.1 phospho-N-acetylmuramoyl-pentapeptide-transferase [Phormidium sp. LEGE 05292]
MDAKSLDSRSLKLSGVSLSVILAVVLSLVALFLDGKTGRYLNPGVSLTLPFWVCAIATAGIGYWVVPLLRSLKAGQVIREDGPQSHLKKGGTPTMGGIFFIPVGAIISVIWSALSLGIKDFGTVAAVAALTLGYGFIGWLDDWQILRRKSNKGISPKMKLALQIGFAALFCLWLLWQQPANITTINLPFGLALPLGLLFWPLAVFVLVAESNATNLTDGVDGLAGGLCAIVFLGLATLVASTHPGLMIFCACLSGSCLGFLAHNRNPARVFMGDTGSLALGGALASVALLSNTLWSLFILSGIFFIETLSVMAQVSYYKATKGPDGVGKRLFKMAPLHHHLELSGWTELQVVASFYTINGILYLLCLLIR